MENFPNLAEEIDFQEVQEVQKVQKSWIQGSTHHAHHNYITQDER